MMATRLIDIEVQVTEPPLPPRPGGAEIARAYDGAGTDYRDYADGDGAAGGAAGGDRAAAFDFSGDFSGRYGFADREVWARIDAVLIDLRARGRHAIRILDLGCGPGTWLLRTAARARDLGFTAIEGRGIDLSPAMIALARQAATGLRDPRIGLSFDVGDILETLEEEGHHACDLALCLYGVLNHVAPAALPAVARALAECTDGALIATVRSTGSLPSIFIAGVEKARRFHQDHEHDRLEIDLVDGRHVEFGLHLFRASELRALFAPHCAVRELAGIDLFHSRFRPERDWNPAADDAALEAGLARLEHFCASDPVFIDRAAHILLLAGPLDP
jgi:SAM-dependent methyltransferase